MSARSRSKKKSLRRNKFARTDFTARVATATPASVYFGGRFMTILKKLTPAPIVTTPAASSVYAQAQRLAGEIKRVEGNLIFADGRDGKPITVKLADNVVVTAVLKATVADIKPGAYIGSGAVPQADGSQKAVEVHIFAESQ